MSRPVGSDRPVPRAFYFKGQLNGDVAEIVAALFRWNVDRRRAGNRRHLTMVVTEAVEIGDAGTYRIFEIHGHSREIGYDDLTELVNTMLRQLDLGVRYFVVHGREWKVT
jgi:hypothetical protein